MTITAPVGLGAVALALRANSRAPATDSAATAGVPVAWAAARRSTVGVARGLWMGAKMTLSNNGKRIWANSTTGLSRRQLKTKARERVSFSVKRSRRPARNAQAPAAL